jgi:hypothetical protein
MKRSQLALELGRSERWVKAQRFPKEADRHTAFGLVQARVVAVQRGAILHPGMLESGRRKG